MSDSKNECQPNKMHSLFRRRPPIRRRRCKSQKAEAAVASALINTTICDQHQRQQQQPKSSATTAGPRWSTERCRPARANPEGLFLFLKKKLIFFISERTDPAGRGRRWADRRQVRHVRGIDGQIPGRRNGMVRLVWFVCRPGE